GGVPDDRHWLFLSLLFDFDTVQCLLFYIMDMGRVPIVVSWGIDNNCQKPLMPGSQLMYNSFANETGLSWFQLIRGMIVFYDTITFDDVNKMVGIWMGVAGEKTVRWYRNKPRPHCMVCTCEIEQGFF